MEGPAEASIRPDIKAVAEAAESTTNSFNSYFVFCFELKICDSVLVLVLLTCVMLDFSSLTR